MRPGPSGSYVRTLEPPELDISEAEKRGYPVSSACMRRAARSWNRRNWLPMPGFLFIGAHVGIYHLPKTAKLSSKTGHGNALKRSG
ncbi:uncharacterized protein [Pituophis catenifer annectens]|uniref:uncharacterized protein n=1 Tax=Pituophis catenifer annectens TaxID=94852 RepID=UPI003994BC7D